MATEIPTEIEEQDPPFDDGVMKGIEAREEFVFDGEQVERETQVQFLEDGGVHLVQKTQTTFDSLTLNEDVVRRLILEYEP